MFRLALVLAVFQLQSAFALDCPLCSSYVGWYDCARTAVVQNCSQHDPVEDKANRTNVFCYQLELMEPSTHAAHFQLGCTSDASFCSKESARKDVRHCSADEIGNFTDGWQISNKTADKNSPEVTKLTTTPSSVHSLPETQKLVDTPMDTTVAPSVTEKPDHTQLISTTKKSMPSTETIPRTTTHSTTTGKSIFIDSNFFPTVDPKYLAGNASTTVATTKSPINGGSSNGKGGYLRTAQLLVAICLSRWIIY